MAHLIDRTLMILRDVMSAHKASLVAGRDSPLARDPPSARDLPSARDSPSAAATPGGAAVSRLLAAVEERCGLDSSGATAERLLRALQGLAADELELHVERMTRLPADDPQWCALIEQLTVHETYIMRDPEQLQFFATQLPRLIDDARAARRFRLRFWSVGCSGGQEAYTIAALAHAAMIDAGLAHERTGQIALSPPWRIEVLGGDISSRALATARTGIYHTGPLSSFRGELQQLLRYFPPATAAAPGIEPAARMVHDCLRAAVRFERFNIVADPVPAGMFDAVICRNVLVHFSARARAHAQQLLQSAVRPGGYLVLGPTDALAGGADFEALWAPGAVIQRRRGAND